jgi:hypothetical protein
MQTPHSTFYKYSPETVAAANKLAIKTVDEQAHKKGMMEGEPLTVAFDALLKYAEAYRIRFESPLSGDFVLGVYWLDAIKGLHGLLNGDGANALKRGITTDSKSNGALESVYWSAMDMAGFGQDDVA